MMVFAALGGMIALSQAASAVSLKQNSIVSGNTITLGDVFHGLSEGGDKVLGIAPQPGQEMTLNARTLLRIAVAMDLPWRPASSADQITLTRAASIVDRDMIENALRAEVEKQGVSGKYNIVLPDVSAKMVLAPDIAPAVEIADFNMKPETGWFEATAYAPSAANPIQKIKINGTVQKMVSVPVLREPMRAGLIIGARDIDYIDIKESDVRHDMILKAENLIGMTPRRLVTSGKPLNTVDIESPQIIARGDVITMMFKSGPMTLTASGKALQNGAKGETIRVVNNTSNKTIEGIVTASKEVTVESF
jgi:flagella basal body P-ring formation protein FlgA